MIRSLLTALALIVSAQSFAQAAFVEGKDYFRLPAPQATQAPKGKVEVLELFSYGCVHCALIERHVVDWKQRMPANVTFRRDHVVYEEQTRNLARAYHALVAMKAIDQAHPVLFEDVSAQRLPPTDLNLLGDKLAKIGINKGTFLATTKSFSVTQKVKQAEAMQPRYQLGGTPEFIVNGKYRVSIPMADTPDAGRKKAMAIIDFVVQKELIGTAAKPVVAAPAAAK